MRLKDKTAIVTGASRGIGKAIALAFAREGARVTLNYVANDDAARQAMADVDKVGPPALLVKADVSDAAQVEAMFDRCLREFGHLDILVNNASAEIPSAFWNLSEADWDRVLGVSLKPVFCARGRPRGT